MNTTFKKSQGYILHESTTSNGHDFAVIVTGVKKPTDNSKTGNMLQIWILLSGENPVEAVQSGLDAVTICSGCPFASGNGCYVNIGQAPLAIYKAYKRGAYPHLAPSDYHHIFTGRKVRFGAYGNPTLIPLDMIESIAELSDGWTGYFHNWKEMTPENRTAYNSYFMVSTESKDSYELAKSLELRVFHASPDQPAGTLECLSDSHGIACADCRLCAGTAKRAKDVWINPHGSRVARALDAIGYAG